MKFDPRGAVRWRGDGLRQARWAVGLDGLQLVVTFASLVLLGRNLGPETYGAYYGLYAVIAVLGIIAASGLNLTLRDHVLRRGEDVGVVLRSCLSLALGLGIGLTVVGLAVCHFVVPQLSVDEMVGLFLVEFVAAPIVLLVSAARLASEGFVQSARVRLTVISARFAALVLLGVPGWLTIERYGMLYLGITAVLAVIWVRWIGRAYDMSVRPGSPRWNDLKTSAVYTLGIGGMSVQNEGDKAVLSANNVGADAGLYGTAYRLVQFGFLPILSLAEVSHRQFLDPTRTDTQVRRAAKFGSIAVIYGVVAGAVLWLAAPVLPYITGDGFVGSITMVRWLTPLVALRAFSMFPLNGLMGLGRTPVRSAIQVAAAALSLGLYIVLIPSMGWEGALVGTLVGEAALGVAAWVTLLVLQRRVNQGLLAEQPAIATEHAPAVSEGVGP